MKKSWEHAIRQLVRDMVDGRFAAIAASGRIGRLSEAELRDVIVGYGRTLVELPDDAFAQADVDPASDGPVGDTVDVALWTAEEGRSDLTLTVTVRENGEGVAISIDDVHVL